MPQVVSRRQEYRFWRIKDPSAEVTTKQNLRVRLAIGAQNAGQRRRLVVRSGTDAANRLLFLLKRNIRLDLPTNAGKFYQAGAMAARASQSRVMQNRYQAERVAFANMWPQPFDPTVYPGEVTFNELVRVASFTEYARSTFTELDRGE